MAFREFSMILVFHASMCFVVQYFLRQILVRPNCKVKTSYQTQIMCISFTIPPNTQNGNSISFCIKEGILISHIYAMMERGIWCYSYVYIYIAFQSTYFWGCQKIVKRYQTSTPAGMTWTLAFLEYKNMNCTNMQMILIK